MVLCLCCHVVSRSLGTCSALGVPSDSLHAGISKVYKDIVYLFLNAVENVFFSLKLPQF